MKKLLLIMYKVHYRISPMMCARPLIVVRILCNNFAPLGNCFRPARS